MLILKEESALADNAVGKAKHGVSPVQATPHLRKMFEEFFKAPFERRPNSGA